jgi:hypothetical protein
MTGIAALCAGSSVGHSATRCGTSGGVQTCTSGLELSKFDPVRQRCEEWCWAACIQAVFSMRGRETAQETAVEKIFGTKTCRGASTLQIIQAINGEWIDQYGFKFRAGAELLPEARMAVSTSVLPQRADQVATNAAINLFSNDGAKRIVTELDAGNPLIIGVAGEAIGHATVLTAATYTKDNKGFIGLQELVIRDPWPANPNRRTLKASEVRGVMTMVRVWIN